MNNTKLVEKNFKLLRDICHRNPIDYLEKAENYKEKYKDLKEIHFLFIDAYAYTKIRRFDLAEAILNSLISLAVSTKDSFFIVHGNLMLSLCYHDNSTKAKTFLEVAEENARVAQDPLLLAACFAYQGDYYLNQNSYDLAEERHQQVQQILGDNGESQIRLQSLMSLANICISAKRIKKSLRYLREALIISDKDKNYAYSMNLKNNLAKALMELKRYDDAEKVLIQAKELSIKLDSAMQTLQLTFSLASLKLTSKDYQQALAYLDECHALAKELSFNNPQFLMDLFNNYAIAQALKGNTNDAIAYMEKASKIAVNLDDKNAELEIYINLAKMLLKLKHYEQAEDLLLRCLKRSSKFKLNDYVFTARNTLAKLYQSKKDYPKCISMLQKNQTELCKQITKLKENYQGAESNNLTYVDFEKHLDEESSLTNKDFVGISKSIHKVLHQAHLVAKQANVSVLIRGESGTGKEVLANLIHNNSIRKDSSLIAINAAAIASSLMESELFGHKKGSYTGAISNEKGFFLQANNGTLFIDEITEIPVEFQAKLLRVLESRKVIPVGTTNEISFDARIISSTNRPIKELIDKDLFRIDLFYRINTIEIIIPPLRERKEDIPVLVEHFVNMFSKESNRLLPNIKSSFIKRLEEYSFPGNVRELKNIIEKLFILGETTYWDAKLLDNVCNLDYSSKDTDALEKTNEKEKIIKALISCKGVRRDAAKSLNMSNSTMTRRIEKYGLEAYASRIIKKKR